MELTIKNDSKIRTKMEIFVEKGQFWLVVLMMERRTFSKIKSGKRDELNMKGTSEPLIFTSPPFLIS